ncbi:MAG: transcriptional regulator [Saprospiraceae bacterium]|nr:transcriptional regulator [Saprospiraceae bacterium]
MKELLAKLNPAFDHRNRLAIMALMVSNERIDYNTLRQTLELTDGNLASHLKPLESNGYIQVHKVFIGKKPQTTYSATELGTDAFKAHLEGLEELIHLVE